MKKIIVLLEGTSTEKEVSLKTGEAVYQALIENGKDVEKYYLDDNIFKFCQFLQENKDKIVIFNALHGKMGEDGRIQGLLDLYKIPYTHSSVLNSSLFMDKSLTKILLSNLDIKMAKEQVINPKEFDIKDLKINYPFVIKPIDEGSSVGIYLINNEKELKSSLEKMSNFLNVMLEEYIKGIECTVGVLGGRALCVTEIIPKNSFYDYHSKYARGGNEQVLPARVSKQVYQQMINFSQEVFRVSKARGVLRVDFIYAKEEDQVYFLEANTQPGMTETSLLPNQAKYLGISFNDLCEKLLEVATFDT